VIVYKPEGADEEIAICLDRLAGEELTVNDAGSVMELSEGPETEYRTVAEDVPKETVPRVEM